MSNVICLHFSMQEGDTIEYIIAKCHMFTLMFVTCTLPPQTMNQRQVVIGPLCSTWYKAMIGSHA